MIRVPINSGFKQVTGGAPWVVRKECDLPNALDASMGRLIENYTEDSFTKYIPGHEN